MRPFLRFFFVAILSIMIFSCSEKNTIKQDPGDNDEPEEKIFITDRTGKKWDVTHAVLNYGFKISNFQYGLGPNAITPINNPDMISPGEPGYPGNNSTEPVIGLSIEGDDRAYPIRTLSRHEVVNDRVGGKDVAVVY